MTHSQEGIHFDWLAYDAEKKVMLIEFSMSSPSGKSNNSCPPIVHSDEMLFHWQQIDLIASALLIPSLKESGSTKTVKYKQRRVLWLLELSCWATKPALICYILVNIVHRLSLLKHGEQILVSNPKNVPIIVWQRLSWAFCHLGGSYLLHIFNWVFPK